MVCQKCGAKVVEGQKFCDACGFKLIDEDNEISKLSKENVANTFTSGSTSGTENDFTSGSASGSENDFRSGATSGSASGSENDFRSGSASGATSGFNGNSINNLSNNLQNDISLYNFENVVKNNCKNSRLGNLTANKKIKFNYVISLLLLIFFAVRMFSVIGSFSSFAIIRDNLNNYNDNNRKILEDFLILGNLENLFTILIFAISIPMLVLSNVARKEKFPLTEFFSKKNFTALGILSAIASVFLLIYIIIEFLAIDVLQKIEKIMTIEQDSTSVAMGAITMALTFMIFMIFVCINSFKLKSSIILENNNDTGDIKN